MYMCVYALVLQLPFRIILLSKSYVPKIFPQWQESGAVQKHGIHGIYLYSL